MLAAASAAVGGPFLYARVDALTVGGRLLLGELELIEPARFFELDERAPERFAVIGFSMGGYVAREIARLAPERVEALVLVATSARADTPAQGRQKAFAVRNVHPDRFHGLSRGAVLSSLHPNRAGDEAMVERVRAMSERVGGAVFVRHASQARTGDLDRLSSIRCPTLVVAA